MTKRNPKFATVPSALGTNWGTNVNRGASANGNFARTVQRLTAAPPVPYVAPVVARPNPEDIPPAPKRVLHALHALAMFRHACGHEQEHGIPFDGEYHLDLNVECDSCRDFRKHLKELRHGYFDILEERGVGDAWAIALHAYPIPTLPAPVGEPERTTEPYIREVHKFTCGHTDNARFFGEYMHAPAKRKELAKKAPCPTCLSKKLSVQRKLKAHTTKEN